MRWLRHIAVMSALIAPVGAQAQALVADLSDHLIAVTTGFSGAELLLFGAIDDEGDVVVVVRGPNHDVVVRRKEKVAGIWVNQAQQEFTGVPSFYSIASNRPITDIAPEPLLARNQVGVDHLRLSMAGVATKEEGARYREALIRNKQRIELFPTQVGKVVFLGNRLFRTDVVFPSSVPTGAYTVTVYLVRDGTLISAQTTPLVVSRIGFSARLFEFAHKQSAIYGIFAVMIALLAGWGAGAAFRKI